MTCPANIKQYLVARIIILLLHVLVVQATREVKRYFGIWFGMNGMYLVVVTTDVQNISKMHHQNTGYPSCRTIARIRKMCQLEELGKYCIYSASGLWRSSNQGQLGAFLA